MKRITSIVGLAAAALLSGCAVYPDGTPMYGNGYSGYDGYATGVPQTSVYMGYSDYYGPGYYDGPGRYYGPGPGYRGYPGYGDRNRPDNGGWHGQPNGGGQRGGPPPQGAAGGPGGPGGSNAGRP